MKNNNVTQSQLHNKYKDTFFISQTPQSQKSLKLRHHSLFDRVMAIAVEDGQLALVFTSHSIRLFYNIVEILNDHTNSLIIQNNPFMTWVKMITTHLIHLKWVLNGSNLKNLYLTRLNFQDRPTIAATATTNHPHRQPPPRDCNGVRYEMGSSTPNSTHLNYTSHIYLKPY